MACVNNKCVDPCPGVCGINAQCNVYNHAPNCNCLPGYTGNALSSCHEIRNDPRKHEYIYKRRRKKNFY